MTRLYARSRKGERAVGFAPQGHWNTTTLVAAMTVQSPIAPMVLDGPMDTLAFQAYVEHFLVPALPPGAILVMDNLPAHKSPRIAQMLADAQIELWPLPPYSPDFNPIEMLWSKVKNDLRSAKPRTKEELYTAIASALAQVTPSNTKSFFDHVVGIIS